MLERFAEHFEVIPGTSSGEFPVLGRIGERTRVVKSSRFHYWDLRAHCKHAVCVSMASRPVVKNFGKSAAMTGFAGYFAKYFQSRCILCLTFSSEIL